MLSSGFHQVIAPKAKTLNIIWGAFLAACVVYVVVAWIMFGLASGGAEPVLDSPSSGGLLPTIFAVVAILALGASVVAERMLLTPSRLETHLREVPTAASVLAFNSDFPATPSGNQTQLFDRLSDTEKRLVGLSIPYQTANIVIWACRESIVVLGLVLAVLQASFPVILPFAAVGFVTILLKVPRPASVYASRLDLARKFS